MFFVPAVITVIFFALWIAGALDPNLVVKGVTNVMGAPPSAFMTAAIDSGMTNPANIAGFFDSFSFALAGAFWAFMGWYATTFLAGEVKEANKKLPMVLLTAGLVTMVVYLTATSLAAASTMNVAVTNVVGHQWSFFQAYSWLSYPPSGIDTSAAISALGNVSFLNA